MTDRKSTYKKVINEIKKNRIVILKGLRRIGKTELCKSIIKDPFFMDFKIKQYFDSESSRELIQQEMKELIIKATKRKINNKNFDDKIIILWDECMDNPKYADILKSIYDVTENVYVIGSSSWNGEELESVRVQYMPIEPMRFNEWYTMTNYTLSIDEYILSGGYPECVLGVKTLWEIQNLNLINLITKNISKIDPNYSFSSQDMIRYIPKLLEKNIKKWSDKTFIKKYGLSALRKINQIEDILEYGYYSYKIHNFANISEKKMILNSNFLIYDKKSFDKVVDRSLVIESLISSHLREYCELGYIDAKKGNKRFDIDFAIKIDDYIIPIEVKTGEAQLSNNQKIVNGLIVLTEQPSSITDKNYYFNVKTMLNDPVEFIAKVVTWYKSKNRTRF